MKIKSMILFFIVIAGFACFALGGFLINPALGIIIIGVIFFIWAFALHLVIKEEKEGEKKGNNHGR